MNKSYDFAVVGAGVFGAWTSWYLRKSGASVILLDAYGPGNSRSSSGGETRILRAGYGPDELYSRWAVRSFPLWRAFFDRVGQDFFRRTGVLWLGRDGDAHLAQMAELLGRLGTSCERLSGAEINRRYPQLHFEDVTLGVFEPESGVVLARRAVQSLVNNVQQSGVTYAAAEVLPPQGSGILTEIKTASEGSIAAGSFVFACGAWLPRLFPDVLAQRIFPTRQEVFFLGPLPGSDAFRPEKMPAWLHHTHPDRPYVLPDIEDRGVKIAFDCHGPECDPDRELRVIAPGAVDRLRAYLKLHIPMLDDAPIVETRVCQYENTWNGDFLIDRHPGFANVWLVGGGSGHGFKHGPAVGEYLSARVHGHETEEPRFSLASKQARQLRAVY